MRRSRVAVVAILSIFALGLSSAGAMPTIQRGDEGPLVEQLQDWLRLRGYRIDEGGTFGRSTELAVRAVQRSTTLRADGIVSATTWLALARQLLQSDTAAVSERAADTSIPRILPPAFAEDASPFEEKSELLIPAAVDSRSTAPIVLEPFTQSRVGEGASVDVAKGSLVASLGTVTASPSTPATAPAEAPPNPAASIDIQRPTPSPLSTLVELHESFATETRSTPAVVDRSDLFIDVPPGFETETDILRMQTPRVTGRSVLVVQALLNQLGYKLELDGNFGTATAEAVRDFQRRARQTSDGVVGPQTRVALIAAQVRRPSALTASATKLINPTAAAPTSLARPTTPTKRTTTKASASRPSPSASDERDYQQNTP